MNKTGAKKTKLPVWGKMLIAIGGVSVFIVAVFMLLEVKAFADYKWFLERTVNSILNNTERYEDSDARIFESDNFEEIEKKIPFKITKPQWLPEGYKLKIVDCAKFTEENYTVSYEYTHSADENKRISFEIATFGKVNPKKHAVEYEEITINKNSVFIICDDSQENYRVEYINNQGFQVTINGAIDRETLIKIIENMS